MSKKIKIYAIFKERETYTVPAEDVEGMNEEEVQTYIVQNDLEPDETEILYWKADTNNHLRSE